MMLVLLQLLLRQREHLFAHQRGHRDLNPLRARPLVSTHVAAWQRFPLTKGTRDAAGAVARFCHSTPFPDTRDCAADPKPWTAPSGPCPSVLQSVVHSVDERWR